MLSCLCPIPVRKRISKGIVIGLLGIFVTACVFQRSAGNQTMTAENHRGAVFLQRVEDGWFRTAHPFELKPVVLAMVFRGMRVQVSPADTVAGDRVFSDEDAEFLSPLMSGALSKATKHQVVGFRVVRDTDRGQEITGGILYVQGRLLHLTLTHYRARQDYSERGGLSGFLHPNPTGLDQHQVAFSPEAARRSSRHEQPDVTAEPPLASLVLEYEALVTGSDHQSTPGRSRLLHQDKPSVIQQIIEPISSTRGSSVSQDIQPVSDDAGSSIQAPVQEKEREIEAIKGEMRLLQRRLSELDAEVQKPKKP